VGHPPENRWGLLISGIASAVLGVIVLFNIVTATFTLLGVLLGVQVLLEGLTLAFFGRPQARRRVPTDSAAAAASA
jgi:membrane protein HdeD